MSRRHHHHHDAPPPAQAPEKCTNCGATLDAQPVPAAIGGFDVFCAFCGHRHHIAAPEPERPDPPPRVDPPRRDDPPAAAPRKPASRAGIVIGAVVAVLVLGGITASLVVRRAGRPSTGGLTWDSARPIVATIGGSEALVGRLRDRDADRLYVGAFDATTMALRWKAGPYGTYAQAYQNTRVVVAGSHVAVADAQATVHILDLQTGQEQRKVTLTDKVDSSLDSEMLMERLFCRADDGHVWLKQIDKRTVNIDLGTGAVTEAPQPPACLTGMVEQPSPFPGRPPEHIYQFSSLDFKTTGFQALSMMPLEATGAYVKLGKKSPGTPTPMVASFDKTSKALLWKEPLAAEDAATVRDGTSSLWNAAVCGNWFVAAYGVGTKSWHVATIDAVSAARVWDVELGPGSGVGSVSCSAHHVFLSRGDALQVLDAATGKPVGTFG